MNPIEQFNQNNVEKINNMSQDKELKDISLNWLAKSVPHEYSYHFTWLGRPIIQYPQDMIATQELIWNIQPDLIIETGIAHGGSLIFYASILELIGKESFVLGIDIDIREHNKKEIENHPLFKRIELIEGSSVSDDVIEKVKSFVKNKKRVMVILDSNHTHEHVFKELELYSPFVTKDSYLIVLDTLIQDMPKGSYPNRDWGIGNNPKTAVWEFLKENNRFVIDESIHNKLLITVAEDGYLKCVKE